MKKINFILFIILIIAAAIFYYLLSNRPFSKNLISPKYSTAVLGGRTLIIELADTPIKQERGLSNVKELAENRGMLFAYPDKQIRNFWMKNMNFTLDLIWLNDNKIIGITKNLPPKGNSPLTSYSSNLPVNYVLEINGGLSDKYNIKVNDNIIINL